MTSLHALPNTFTEVSTMQVPVAGLKQLTNIENPKTQKWTYLIADNICFSEKQAFSIRLPKPEQSTLGIWLERIIINGQCSVIFVEKLHLEESQLKLIQTLCNEHNVTLVNLLRQEDIQTNIIKGPW